MHNTTKHTPGPWGRIVELGCDVYAISKDPESHTFVAECAIEEDARFIAAAPAMYEELKEGLVLLEASHHDMVDMYGIDSLQAKTVWERIESTRNVIAQAEGK